MKILQVIHSLGYGGAEKFVIELSNELSKKQTVTVCTFKPTNKTTAFVSNLSSKVELHSFNRTKKYSFRILFRLLKLIKTQQPDIVHVHLHNSFYYIFFLSIFLKKTKFVHTIHNELFAWNGIFKPVNFFGRFQKNLSHVCISRGIYQQFIQKYKKSFFVHIDNGINKPPEALITDLQIKLPADVFRNENNARVFLTIGNYAPFKNFDLLISVFAEITAKHTLIIVGNDDTPEKECYNRIEENKTSNVHLAGYSNNIFAYLRQADALLISSTHEGMPLVVIEALSCGTPVISTPAGGIVDMVVPGENGFLSADFTKEGLLKAINDFLDCSPEQLGKIKNNNIKKFNDCYTIESCVGRYIELAYK